MNNINFELYKMFYYVCKNKNLTKTANELFISQPAVTQSIKKLEDEIGYKLFYRTKQGMELTNEGEKLFNYIKIPIECLNIGKERVEKDCLDVKTIKIGSGITLIKHTLIKPLMLFKKLHSNIKIEIFHGTNAELLNMLSNDLIDMVLMNLPTAVNENIELFKVEEVQDTFIAKTDIFGKYKNKILSFDELNKLPLILQKSSSTSRNFLNNVVNKNGIELKPEYELGSYSLVLDFIIEGLGVGFVNKKHVKKELKSGELFEIRTNFEIPKREIGVAINKKNNYNKVINEFINIMKKS